MPRPSIAIRRATLALLLGIALPALAQHAGHGTHSPYAGMQERAIKSLSQADLDELRRGGGWGLALPAELNGYPGPVHLLELKDESPLRTEQVAHFEERVERMRTAAIPAGQALIDAEKAIERAFAEGRIEDVSLRHLIADAEAARAELRFIHLSEHVRSVGTLEPMQIERYQVLRGYAADPCSAVPDGHNPEMYRRHMGCK